MKTPPTTHPEYREHVLDTFCEGLLTGSFDRTHALRQIAVEKHREAAAEPNKRAATNHGH